MDLKGFLSTFTLLLITAYKNNLVSLRLFPWCFKKGADIILYSLSHLNTLKRAFFIFFKRGERHPEKNGVIHPKS